MSNKPERQPEQSHVDQQSLMVSEQKPKKRKNASQKKLKKTDQEKKKHQRKEKNPKKTGQYLRNYLGERQNDIHSVLKEEHGIILNTHLELNLWRRKLQLLSKPHLPDYFRLFDNESFDSILTAQRIYPLLNKKAHTERFLFEKDRRRGKAYDAKSLQEQEKPIYLIALEELVFHKFSKAEFVHFFNGTLSPDELAKIADILKISDDFIYWPIGIFEPYNHDLKDLTEIMNNFQIRDQKANFLTEILKFQELSISRQISQMPNSDQHYKTSSLERQSEKQFSDEESERDKKEPEQMEMGPSQREEELMEEMRSEQIWQRQFELKFFGWFIGTPKYLTVDTNLIPWNKMGEKRTQIFKKNRFGMLIPQLNEMIDTLNRFHSQVEVELKVEESKMFLKRLCEYVDEQERCPCIPFRYEIVKAEKLDKIFQKQQKPQEKTQKQEKSQKKVLIRCFYSDSSELKWVPFNKVRANYTLPIFRDQDLIYLYLGKKERFGAILCKYLFKQFYFRERQPINEVFVSYYPYFHFDEEQIKMKKCLFCKYIIDPLPYTQCVLCQEFCHLECTKRKQSVFFQIFQERETNRPFWICDSCEPCSVCYEAVGGKSLKCKQCQQYFHHLCGRIKGLFYDDIHHKNVENFICQSCLKCHNCKKKLKDKDYYYNEVDNSFVCHECYLQLISGSTCYLCMTSKNGAWIECDQCKKWIHEACDKIAIGPGPKQSLKFWCPNCRQKQLKLIMCEIISTLIEFDELQFFTEPSYQKLPLYKSIISEPMCFAKMKQKALEGIYQENPREKITVDLNLIVNNALQYNMPKDPAYFQAKILKIMCEKALEELNECFYPQIQDIISGQIYQIIDRQKKKLHAEINDHYLQLLLNYHSEKSKVQIDSKKKQGPSSVNEKSIEKKKQAPNYLNDKFVFSTPLILSNIIKNSTVYFHLKKQKLLIEDLFKMVKNNDDKGLWRKIKGDVCYYHNCSDIISYCDICCESYCCVEVCFKHRRCSCGIKGCRCDSFDCGCVPQKQKQRKLAEKKVIEKYQSKYKTNKQIIMEYTENYKYCYKCAPNTLDQRMCFKCNKLCSWGYSKCQKCHRRWHKSCQKVYKIYNLCSQCCQKAQSLSTVEQYLFIQCKAKLLKTARILKYTPMIAEIYYRQGIRLNSEQIQHLLLENYDQFLAREKSFYNYEYNQRKKQKKQSTSEKQIKNSLLEKYFQHYCPEPYEFQNMGISPLNYIEKIKQYFDRFLRQTPIQKEQQLFQKVNREFYEQVKQKNRQQKMEEVEHELISQLKAKPLETVKKMNLNKKNRIINDVHSFLMLIYQQNKMVLRKGSTCIIRTDKNYWKILKKWARETKQYEIILQKQHKFWYISINKQKYMISTIGDIIEKLRPIARIEDFQELGQFLGFSIYDVFYQAAHYTRFLQSHLLDEMPLQQRMKMVTSVYDEYSWGKDGIFTFKEYNEEEDHQPITYECNITKNPIYYLNKRKKDKKEKEEKETPKIPFISFEDLKRYMEENTSLLTKPQSLPFKGYTASNEVFIAPSKIHKLGLFSRKPLKKNTIVIEYIGQIVSESVADLREIQFHFGCYMFSIGKTNDKMDIIDATFRGNMARYLNHSCDPNCKAKTQYVNSWPRIIIYAIRDIKEFEEITYDYQFNVDAEDKLECTCGAKNCQGRLN